MTAQKAKALSLRWFSDYHFFKQLARREEDPSMKKCYQDKAEEAKKEYDQIIEQFGGRK